MNGSYDVVSFKADKGLMELLRGVSNRSEFIRSAILSAFDHLCPLCKGTGVLTPHKRQHLDDVSTHLKEQECDECDADIITRQKVSK